MRILGNAINVSLCLYSDDVNVYLDFTILDRIFYRIKRNEDSIKKKCLIFFDNAFYTRMAFGIHCKI